MTAIKVQGEQYDTREEALMAANELQAKMDDLPESHPARPQLAGHIERLRTAAGAESQPGANPSQGDEEPERTVEPPPAPPAPEQPEQQPTVEPPESEPGAPPESFLCPICSGRGYLPIEPPHDPESETCPRCSGYGKVITGSNVEGHELRDCPDCQGQGYIQARTIYSPQALNRAASSPGLPGAQWNAEEEVWEPPLGASAPWAGAEWDKLRGAYQ